MENKNQHYKNLTIKIIQIIKYNIKLQNLSNLTCSPLNK